MAKDAIRGSYDLVVIGAGPAGKRGAIQAAKAGKSVLLVDKGASVGGVCVHTGTIPSKTMRETILNLSGWREREFYGHEYKVKQEITAEDVQKRVNVTIDHEVDILEDQFDRNDVDRISATAKFTSANSIDVTLSNGDVLSTTFEKALLAVGTKPYRPENVPFDRERILDSDEILDIPRMPKSLIIIGAGVIAVEYATIFNALGIAVTVIEPREKMLDFLDDDIVENFVQILRDRRMILTFGSAITKIRKTKSGCEVQLKGGRSYQSDMILFAGGRVGATDNLGLEACGLKPISRGLISINGNNFQTKVPHIYAAGDVVGFPSLASTSMEQGRIAACHAFNIQMSSPPDYFPYGIYSVPEISTIGLTEREIKATRMPYECGIAKLRETSRGQIMGVQTGLMKMIFSRDTKQLLGVHIIGEGATELIHIGQAVLNLGGKLDFFINNIFNYPTLAEAYKVAALDAWNKMQNVAVDLDSQPKDINFEETVDLDSEFSEPETEQVELEPVPEASEPASGEEIEEEVVVKPMFHHDNPISPMNFISNAAGAEKG